MAYQYQPDWAVRTNGAGADLFMGFDHAPTEYDSYATDSIGFQSPSMWSFSPARSSPTSSPSVYSGASSLGGPVQEANWLFDNDATGGPMFNTEEPAALDDHPYYRRGSNQLPTLARDPSSLIHNTRHGVRGDTLPITMPSHRAEVADSGPIPGQLRRVVTAPPDPTAPRFLKVGDLFVCRECDQRFTVKSNFTRHDVDVHRNGRTTLCNFCGKTFTRRDNLKKHFKTCPAMLRDGGVQRSLARNLAAAP